ncbi:MAG: glutathione binding-like protein [Neomegalonema sp.]|nr:glutathione binding-like protein [Neomegalonema sp.]
MTEYRLHCFAQSGNAYKPALMMALTDVEWAPVFVDFFNGAHRTEAFYALNPMGEVPVLEGPEGTFSQSGVILRMLARKTQKFGPASQPEDDEILRWLLWDNQKLTGYVAPYRFMLNFLPEAKRDAGAIAFLNGRRRIAFKILEQRLSQQDWLALPDRATIADISACGYLFWLDEIGESRDDWPAIGRWLERLEKLPGWRHPYALMPGHPLPGREG